MPCSTSSWTTASTWMAWLCLDYVIDFLRIAPVRQVNKLGFLIGCSAAGSMQNASFQGSLFVLILSNMCWAVEELMAVRLPRCRSLALNVGACLTVCLVCKVWLKSDRQFTYSCLCSQCCSADTFQTHLTHITLEKAKRCPGLAGEIWTNLHFHTYCMPVMVQQG